MMSFDRRRAMGVYLWIAVAGILALYLYSVSYLLTDETGDAVMAFSVSRSLGYVSPILPLMAALPFGTAFCADWQSGYASSVVMRSGRRRYLTSKMLACALSGGLASLMGMLAFILTLSLKFPPDFSEAPFIGDITGLYALLGVGAGSYLAFFGAHLMLAFLSGMFWALTALTFSAFYPNVALTLCAPPVMHRLLEELGYWTPEWLDVTLLESGALDLPPATILAAGAGVFCALSALLMLLFAWRAGRRLRYEA